jgi:hypothetical protein
MARITRFLAAASLMALLTACGGEGARDREEAPVDREKPSLGSPKADDDGQDKKDEKESRGTDEKESRRDEDGDSND